MNRKEEFLHDILNVVVSCCATEFDDGTQSVTAEDVLSRERIGDVAHMTRCILVRQISAMGFSNETSARMLKRTESTIRDMLSKGNDLESASYAYRIASEDAAIKCRELMSIYSV